MATLFAFPDPNSASIAQFATAELPSSPTAALWNSTEEEKNFRRKVKKSVKFTEEVKAHDGLTCRNALLDRLVTAYFVDQREVSELDVLSLTGNDVQNILNLHEDLVDLINRINEALAEGKQCAPVLPRGGGMCTKLMGAHLPYIRILDRVVEAAANRCLANIRRQTLAA